MCSSLLRLGYLPCCFYGPLLRVDSSTLPFLVGGQERRNKNYSAIHRLLLPSSIYLGAGFFLVLSIIPEYDETERSQSKATGAILSCLYVVQFSADPVVLRRPALPGDSGPVVVFIFGMGTHHFLYGPDSREAPTFKKQEIGL